MPSPQEQHEADLIESLRDLVKLNPQAFSFLSTPVRPAIKKPP